MAGGSDFQQIAARLASVGVFLAGLWQLWTGALALDPAAYQAVASQPQAAWAALLIALVGGLSLGLGQSVILFANRIPVRRFIFSLATGALIYVLSVALWALSIWFIAGWGFGQHGPFWSTLALVCLAFAPTVFGFLVLLPYLGYILHYLLYFWVLVDLLFGLHTLHGFNLWQGLLAAGAGWLVIQFLAHTRLVERLLYRWLPEYAAPPDVVQLALAYADALPGEYTQPPGEPHR